MSTLAKDSSTLSIFACPKPFVDPHISMIQRNAIRSWTLLRPRPQITLFGNEAGVSEICREFGLAHVPNVKRNEFGTPLLNDVFAKASCLSDGNCICYINADIVLMRDVERVIGAAARMKRPFLMGGRPWALDVSEPMQFSPGWEEQLRHDVAKVGTLRDWHACDYFVFSKNLWKNLPPFALGRSYFDNALLYLARKRGPLVDATPEVMAVHQNHPYPAWLGGDLYLTNPEALRNIELAGGRNRLYCWRNATHVLTPGGVKLQLTGYLRICGLYSKSLYRWRKWFWFPVLAATRTVRHLVGLRSSTLRSKAARLKFH